MILKPHEMKAHLVQMLQNAGQDTQRLDLLTTWRVFQVFCAAIPVETVTDAVLIQWGWYKRMPEPYATHYTLSFLRQVDDEDNTEFEQLDCVFFYELDDKLHTLGNGNKWCFFKGEPDVCNLNTFFNDFEQSPIFQTIITYTPAQTAIWQDNTG